MKTYNQFREELKYAYPITHGELKLPIVAKLENFDIDFDKVVKNLDNYYETTFGKKDQVKEIDIIDRIKNYVHIILYCA